MPRRILIVGISGTGKSFLARALGEKMHLPVIHMDSLIWEANWHERPEPSVAKKLKPILVREAWIIEGWLEPLSRERLERAELVVYLDYTGFQAMLGGLRRWWQYRGAVRPELPAGCVEAFDWDYLQVMRRREERPTIEHRLRDFTGKVVRLSSPKQTRQWLSTIP